MEGEEGLAETFVAITGAPMETAIYFLEMSGYSLDTAVQFFFEGGQGFDQGFGSSAPSAAASNEMNIMKILFKDSHPPDSWLCQGLSFDYFPDNATDWAGIGIPQLKNGPCGVLVAFQATVIANLMEAHRLVPNIRPTDEDIVQAIIDILLLNREGRDSVSVCTWSDPMHGVGSSLEIIEVPLSGDDRDSVAMIVFSVLDQFKAPGGLSARFLASSLLTLS
jgi:hypothetical protein